MAKCKTEKQKKNFRSRNGQTRSKGLELQIYYSKYWSAVPGDAILRGMVDFRPEGSRVFFFSILLQSI
jgi:hypothetical protein